MTKTLTEQWRDGTLNGGYYYLKMKDKKVVIDHTEYVFWAKETRWETKDNDYVKEVLAPVPSYQEFQRLQEQLKEAQHTIYCIANTDGSDCKTILETIIRDANLYLEKWGVK